MVVRILSKSITLFGVFILMCLSVLAQTYDCTDSDGGLNPSEKGIVKFNNVEYVPMYTMRCKKCYSTLLLSLDG